MIRKIAAVICALSLWICTPEYTLASNCTNSDAAEYCMYENLDNGEGEGMSLFTKILIGVLVYAILATLLYRQGGSGNEFASGAGS